MAALYLVHGRINTETKHVAIQDIQIKTNIRYSKHTQIDRPVRDQPKASITDKGNFRGVIVWLGKSRLLR
jgi:hypothetical protein